MTGPGDAPMSLGGKIALTAVASALILGTVAYGVFRLYAF